MSFASHIIFLLVLSPLSRGYLFFEEHDTQSSACPGKSNTLSPWVGEPTKLSSVANGSLYTAGSGDDELYILHVYGTPYSMGYAHGQLLKSQIQKLIPAFMTHVEEEVDQYIKFLPKDLQNMIAKLGLDAVLDLTHELTKKYTSEYFYEEMRGLADGSGLDYTLILRVHMLPELVKAGCSMLGAWGKSVANHSAFVQLRALDWDVDGPLQDAPTVVVYHPDEGHDFANVGWSGWVATISGVSSKGLAISEKHSDEPFGEESRSGIPFNFLMRDVLQFDNTLQDSIRRIQKAHRTCSIWLGVGDTNQKLFRLFEYSYSTANVYDDRNITKIIASRFQKEHCNDSCIDNYSMTDLVYWGVHLGCWNEELRKSYGKLSAEMVIQLLGTVQTGDLQAVVYDLEDGVMYVSNAKSSTEQGLLNAYDRRFVKLDVKKLFKEPRPKFDN